MKKIYLSLFSIAIASVTFSQAKLDKQLIEPKKAPSVREEGKAVSTPISYNKAVFWENTFNTPSDWSFSNTSDPSTDWEISTNAAIAPVAALNPFGFTSVGDGFAYIDSDAQGETATQNAMITYTGTIDCSAYPAVLITFEQAHRRFYDLTYLMVSNDGGNNWTDYEINLGMAVNTNTTNPQLVEMNISAVAANQANVKIAFRYEGAWDWFWAIDDIKMSEASGNDIALGKTWAGDIFNAYDYSIIQTQQIQPLVVGAIATNLGATAAVGSLITVTINDGTSNVHTQTANFDLGIGVTDTIWVTTTFTPLPNKNYTVSFNVAADENTTNDLSIPASVATSDNQYAHDFTAAAIYRYDMDDETAMGQQFEVFQNATLNGLSVKFETGTTAETANLRLRRYSFDNPTFNGLRTAEFIYEYDYTIPATGVIGSGNFTNVNFDIPQTIEAGWIYTIEVRKYAGADRIFFGGSSTGSDDYSTIIYGPFGADPNAPDYFVTTSFSPGIRMNVDYTSPTIGLTENKAVSTFNVYPNPATENVAIDFSMNTESSVEVTITDLSGKAVYTSNLGNKTVGSHSVNVNTTTFSNGIYVVNFKTANGIITEKLVIRK